LLAHNGRFALVSVLGATNRERFGPEDVARLERFTPHLRRALQIRRQFSNSRLHGQILESIVERNPAGIISLGSDGVPLFLNEAIRGMTAARDGLSLDRDGRLVVADRVAAARLTSFQVEALRGRAGGVVHVTRPSGEPPYLVLVSPLPKTEDILSRTQSGVFLVVHDPSRRVVTGAEHIAQLLQVPLGAAKVIDALIRAVELKDYADREGISMNTVKFHLKTAFDRTGTRSQLELLRRTILALDDLGHHLVDRAPLRGARHLAGKARPNEYLGKRRRLISALDSTMASHVRRLLIRLRKLLMESYMPQCTVFEKSVAAKSQVEDLRIRSRATEAFSNQLAPRPFSYRSTFISPTVPRQTSVDAFFGLAV
jgi:hypothetical protein